MLTYYRNRPKDFGAQFTSLTTGNINTFTANVTTRFGIGGVNDKDDTATAPGHTAYIDEMLIGTFTVPVDADGTLLLTIKKFDVAANADKTLATSYDLEALVAKKSERIPFDSGVTDQNRILNFGDYLYAEVVSNSAAIDTQPAAMCLRVLIKFLT